MTVLSMRPDTPAHTAPALLWARQLLPTIEAITRMPGAPPRAMLVGNAGSGKTASLRRLRTVVGSAAPGTAFATGEPDAAIIDGLPADTVLIVDDAHLLGDEQLAALRRRAEDPDASLLVAARPWPTVESLDDIARAVERTLPPIVLGHVGPSDLLPYLEAHGPSMSRSCAQHILEATGGVTWLVAEAVSRHDELDCADDAGHAELHRALQGTVLHRLDTVDRALRPAIESLCAALGSDAAAETYDDEAVACGHAAGLLLRNGGGVPLVRSAVRASMPLHRLARIAGGLEDQDSADATTLIVRRARGAWMQGDTDGAIDLAESASDTARAADGDALADVSAGVWAARGMMSQAHAVYRASAPVGIRSRSLALIAALGSGEKEPEDTGDASDAPAEAAPSTIGVSMALLRRGLRRTIAGECSETVLTDFVRAAEMYTSSHGAGAVPELPAVIAAIAALSVGEVPTAAAVIDDAVSGGHGGSWARARLLLWRAWVSVQRARPVEARDDLARAREIAPTLPARDELLAGAVQVAIARRYEDAAGAEEAWRRTRGVILRTEVDLYLLHPLADLISAATRAGEAARIAPHLERALEITAALGDPPLWIAHLRWAGIQQGILLGNPAHLTPHAKALVAASANSRVAAVMARAGRVWTAVLGGTVDPAAVEAAAEGLASIGLKWDGARLAGHGAARTDDRKIAARLLACARELHPTDAARRAADAGDAADADPGRTAPEELLSDREIEVARLVLQGKTYAEIGEAIFISPRTAEHHIAHIRNRLGATSRSEVLAKLRQLIGDDHTVAALHPVRASAEDESPSRAARVSG